MNGENEDYVIARSKAEQLQELLAVLFSPSQNAEPSPLQGLAMELSVDVLYAIRRLA